MYPWRHSCILCVFNYYIQTNPRGSFKLISQIKSSLIINIFIKILDCLSFRSWTDRESPVRLGKCHYCRYYHDLLKNNFRCYSISNCNLVAVHQLHHHFVGKYWSWSLKHWPRLVAKKYNLIQRVRACVRVLVPGSEVMLECNIISDDVLVYFMSR